MLSFKKELHSLIDELMKENHEINAQTGTCYEYGDIYHSYYNQSDLFNCKAIEFVKRNLESDFFFTEIQLSLISNLESNLAKFEFELEEESARTNQLEDRNNYLFGSFFDSLSNTSKKRIELITNWRTINTYRSRHTHVRDRIDDLKNEIRKASETKSIPDILFFFNDKYLPVFISNISAINTPTDDKLEYLKEFFFHYKALSVISISRSKMIDIKKHLNDHSEKLIKIYRDINIDLNTSDLQFSKYKLISLNEHISIINDKYNRYLTDNRLYKVILHFFPSKKIVDSIIKLLKEGMIVNIAFRISDISRSSVAMEDLAYGSIMPLDVDKIPAISALYDKKYEDKLIIQHDQGKQELTFEELRDDFIHDEDSVVTQVIHLQYVTNDEGVFIQHLDHEFIFYSIDEYDQKINNHKIHGSLNKIKTFKIDNSRIPFHFKDLRGPFLFNVLESHFIHKSLICEYFNDALC
jgi:hypothetical protein